MYVMCGVRDPSWLLLCGLQVMQAAVAEPKPAATEPKKVRGHRILLAQAYRTHT